MYRDIKACSEWHGLPSTQDEVMTKLTSVNPALDLILFADTGHNEAVLSKFNMSIGDISTVPPDDKDYLLYDEPMKFEVDFNDLEFLLKLEWNFEVKWNLKLKLELD